METATHSPTGSHSPGPHSPVATEATRTDAVGNVLPSDYRPDAVETLGRRWKMEYVGMASVFLTIWLVSFDRLSSPAQSGLATLASFFLFLGLKKKTRDHLVTSFLMFVAAALAVPAVVVHRWALPLALFGTCTWAMEGYLEKRRGRIVTLPAILGTFAWTSPLWPLAFAFVAAYLPLPRPEHPGLRRKLALLVLLSAVVAVMAAWIGATRAVHDPWVRAVPDPWTLWNLGMLAVPTALAIVLYWKELSVPHRIHGTLFLVLAPFDDRFVAMFGMSGAIVLAATVFRQSVDSLRWRAAFKHAEWYFFWVVAATAIILLLTR